jgi:hypothetical protein
MRRSLAALVVFLALSVGSSVATARSENRWPAVQEHAFLVNCYATSGGKVAACRCELRWLERRYTYRQIATIFLHDQPRMRRIIIRAARACSP